jgi:hypothetical protein
MLGVTLLLPLALELGTDLQELAGTALAACVLQAVVLWLLRRRARAARQRLIAEVRGLLRDRINNHLQVVLFSLAEQEATAARVDHDHLAQAMTAVAAVSRTLDELSTDSLRAWRERYREALGVQGGVGYEGQPATGGWPADASRESRRTSDSRPATAAASPRDRAAAGSRTRR